MPEEKIQLVVQLGDDAPLKMSLEPRYAEMFRILMEDFLMLVHKNAVYGDSWKSRGGTGAYMTLARPIDRLEQMAKANSYDVFEAGKMYNGRETGDNDSDILDTLSDIRNYLLLVAGEITSRRSNVPS